MSSLKTNFQNSKGIDFFLFINSQICILKVDIYDMIYTQPNTLRHKSSNLAQIHGSTLIIDMNLF